MDAPPFLPLVTVVIPTWNRRALLAHAVASVRAQTYPRWELIVADDGSTDGTAEWVASLGDPRVRLLALPRIGHAGRVRNRGVAAGTGELVAFLDSDDVWLPQKLEVQLRAMRDSGARWCYTRYELMDVEGRRVPRRAGVFRPLSGAIARDVLRDSADVWICSVVAERTLFDQAGGFTEELEVRFREDWELEARLALLADAVAVDETLARARVHSGRKTTGRADPLLDVVRAYDLFLRRNPPPEIAAVARRVRSKHLAHAGAERLARGEYAAAARLFARSLAGPPEPAVWARALARGVRDRFERPGA